MKLTDSCKSGFTLIEVVVSVAIFTLAIALAMGGYMFSLKNSNTADVQNKLDIDVQLAVERLKLDLRLSSLDLIFYAPSGPGPYQALSFPVAHGTDENGVLRKDSDGYILWDETVIYHIRPATPDQLVRTTFKPRDNSLNDAERQAQLEAVVADGVGDDAHNGQNATSQVLFQNLLNWKILPQEGRFDAYAPVAMRDISSLGFVLLGDGSHTFNFKVIGKNDASTGYKMGLDQLMVSPSYSPREAETQSVTYQSGAVATPVYEPGGSWNGNYQLVFPATAVGHNFTLSIKNDLWKETNFHKNGKASHNTSTQFDLTMSPKDYVVKLKGNDISWDAGLQTDSDPVDPQPGLMQNWCVRVMQKGSELADNGNWFDYNGRKCQLKFTAGNTGDFKVTNVFIGESTSSTNASLDFNPGTVQSVTFDTGNVGSQVHLPGTTFESDWVDFEIDQDKNYLVSYRIANNSSDCHPAVWVDNRGSVATTCMVVTNGSAATAQDETWSDDPSLEPVDIAGIIGLAAIGVSYPVSGSYESIIFDTQLEEPKYAYISWDAEVPNGCSIAFKVRTGDEPDLSDASEWDSITASSSNPKAISASYKRYVQFLAEMVSSEDGLSTPKLKDVTIDWTGKERMVNIGGLFTKGPDHGLFEIMVDDEPLRSALIVDLEIYDDVYSINHKTRRVSSSVKVDLTPRNTGL